MKKKITINYMNVLSKMKLFYFLLLFFVLLLTVSFSQSYNSKKMIKYSKTINGISLTIYKFSRERANGVIKAKYFAHNANQRFNTWKKGKEVLLSCSGAFSENWETNSPPLGLCVDNGSIVNRNLIIKKDKHGNSLDGLVIVYSGGSQSGGIAIKDIENGEICTKSPNKCYDIKDNYSDRISFTNWAESNNATVFQLPLMYTNEYGRNYGSLNYGNKKERRFLAICKGYDNVIYHLVIDVPGNEYMNDCAYEIEKMLRTDFKNTFGILVLDTGGKNILYEYMNGYASKIATTNISEATNLLIYYIDK